MNGVRLYLDNLRATNPSPEVLRVIKQIEAEQDALAEAWDEGAAKARLYRDDLDLGPLNPYRAS